MMSAPPMTIPVIGPGRLYQGAAAFVFFCSAGSAGAGAGAGGFAGGVDAAVDAAVDAGAAATVTAGVGAFAKRTLD
jgi:hypothetical protein